MSELPPDLPRLQVIRTYLQQQLKAVDAAIAAAQPPATMWRIEHLPGGGRTGRGVLHEAGCPFAEGKGGQLDRAAALVALAEDSVSPCDQCRPERGLGAAGRPAS